MTGHPKFEASLRLETRGYQARLRELAADTDGSPESWRDVLYRAMEELRSGAFKAGASRDER